MRDWLGGAGKKKRGFYQYLALAATTPDCLDIAVTRDAAKFVACRRPQKLTHIVAESGFRVQACPMRKTSDIIWQDAQHRVLFEILDLIRESTADREVLCRLEDYTNNHFALEEHYMKELNYPGRIEHMQAHARFREEISELLAGEQVIDEVFGDIISTFLTEWLTRHVFGIDKDLENFILQSPAK